MAIETTPNQIQKESPNDFPSLLFNRSGIDHTDHPVLKAIGARIVAYLNANSPDGGTLDQADPLNALRSLAAQDIIWRLDYNLLKACCIELTGKQCEALLPAMHAIMSQDDRERFLPSMVPELLAQLLLMNVSRWPTQFTEEKKKTILEIRARLNGKLLADTLVIE